ncbi:MAG: hypothetical protein ACI9C4_002821 [Paraglaciecola sp.]|jgi:hypothetical protein
MPLPVSGIFMCSGLVITGADKIICYRTGKVDEKHAVIAKDYQY